jgi:hypothetical protein
VWAAKFGERGREKDIEGGKGEGEGGGDGGERQMGGGRDIEGDGERGKVREEDRG